jgi:hypothetical protein
MSHFTVLVIGADVEKQLQPFHEFECTGIDDQFVQDVDVTEECRANGLDYYGLDDRTVESEADVDRDGDHKFGFAVVKDGQILKAVNRTNPNKKWDWWQIGGRWSGFLKLKPGADGLLGNPGLLGSRSNSGPGYADQAAKGAIDFDGMRDDAGKKAGARFDSVHAIIAGRDFTSWAQSRENHPGNIDAARAFYNSQPVVQDIANSDILGWFEDLSTFSIPREQFVQKVRDSACATFAVLKDGQWFEKGSMGWWGAVSDEKDADEWNRQFSELVDNLPDDELLTVVDCHI